VAPVLPAGATSGSSLALPAAGLAGEVCRSSFGIFFPRLWEFFSLSAGALRRFGFSWRV